VAFPALGEANQWHQLFADGVAPSPRYQHSAAWDSDGMYIFGGWGIAGPTNDVHFYDRQADVKKKEHVRKYETLFFFFFNVLLFLKVRGISC